MSVIQTRTVKINGKNFNVNTETYESSADIVQDCRTRRITDSAFDDMQSKTLRKNFHGVQNYDEALILMSEGWNKEVKELQKVIDTCKTVEGKRIAFKNDIQGFAPIVPLAILGVPNSMINTRMKPIKSKVISIYYDMTISFGTSTETIIKNGKKLIEALIRLENSGYRVNLFMAQSYNDSEGADIVAVRIKSANRPLDLKRVCFPIMHPAIFRVIGFDWYSKFPKGKYRSGYGHAIGYDGEKKVDAVMRECFGKESVYLSAVQIEKQDVNYIIEKLKGGAAK